MTLTLVHEATGTPVKKGEKVLSFRGEKAIVTSWEQPRHEGSTGRIYVKWTGATHEAGYFPGVFGCKFIELNV